MKKLVDSLLELLGSRRFWMIIAGGVLVGLQENNWKLGAITALTGIVAVGTADKAAEKIGGVKSE